MDWKGIVIHHSASPDVSANTITKWHKQRNFKTIGYHFVIRKNGNIEPGRAIDKQGAHAKGRNQSHIGICITGKLNQSSPTVEQLCSLIKLLRGLRARYGFDLESIEGHHENCPGDYFPLDLVRQNLNKE